MLLTALNSRFFLLNIVVALFLPAIIGQIASACDRFCGFPDAVPFPFGFSDDCKIPLNCSNEKKITIDDFEIQNITGENLMLQIPANCSRRIESIKGLFGKNYAVTWRNGLLLQSCKTTLSGCVIPTALLKERLNLSNCARNDNVSCYSKAEGLNDSMLMRWDNVSKTGCIFLFSSVAVESTNPMVSLDFLMMELEWWVDGNCSCSENADCVQVDPGKSFRCRCHEGFQGDGFRDGNGCRKISSKCNASKYMSGRCGGTTRVGVLIGGLLAGAFVMAAAAFVFYCIRKRSTNLKSRMSAKHLLTAATGDFSVPLYPYREIEKATNYFSENERLGTGAYGTVYAGKLPNDEWVAVKKIRHRDNNSIEQVMNEIKLLSSVSHPNLVRLLGCCIEKGQQILVYEFMPNGTLSQHLQRERGTGLPWTVRLTIAAETAQAIAHLHSAINPPIYHRDIKSSNILLDRNYNSKVADFGLSRLGLPESSYISTAPQGTPGYLDPQYHQNFHLSDKSDVYSFGVVLVEIITALKVVDFSRAQSEVNLAALAIDRIGKGCVDEIIDPFLVPHSDAWTLVSINKVAELAFRCLAFHRDMRPSMMEVAAELELIRFSGWCQLEDRGDLSSCSSLSKGSVESELSHATSKKTVAGSKRSVVPQRVVSAISTEEVKGESPVSIQDHWFSEQSSPSTNSLLGNVIQ